MRERYTTAQSRGGFKVRDTVLLGILLALTLSGGLTLYVMSRWLPVPGAKFLAMAPYVGCMMFMALIRLSHPRAMTIMGGGLGVALSLISPVMGLVALAAGLISDLTAQMIPIGRESVMRPFRAALYPMYCFLLALIATNYLTGDLLFGAIGALPVIIGTPISFGLGFAGAAAGANIERRIRLGHADSNS